MVSAVAIEQIMVIGVLGIDRGDAQYALTS